MTLGVGLTTSGCTKIEPTADFDATIMPNKAAIPEPPKSTSLVITDKSKGTFDLCWKAADYGRNIPSKYTVYFTKGDQKTEINIPLGQKTLSIDLLTLNKQLIEDLGLKPQVEEKLEITIESLPISQKGNPKALEKYRLTSQPIALTVTAFQSAISLYYLVGDISGLKGAPTWNPSNTDYLLFTDESHPTEYHYFGYFKQGAEFKIFPEDCIGGWSKPVLGIKDGKFMQDGGAENIKMPKGSKAGYYHVIFTVNKGTLKPEECTIKFEEFEPTDRAPFKKMGIIGTAGLDWSNDLFLEQAKGNPHLWIGRNLKLQQGEFKLRADADWSHNWGAPKKNIFPETFGVFGAGENWTVTEKNAGTYTLYFNDLTGNYYLGKKATK